ncbi:hypothetical protein B0H16DRAFT_1770721 [Mycena metata]|uniref:Uncharacterized protein n=1 Tax=Mycena metata TaxID=1033252 RepID=A0AAD7I070_9AGAR|nr:hypothetical protein B0H16DRAFT_1770721 [Mycena metata]
MRRRFLSSATIISSRTPPRAMDELQFHPYFWGNNHDTAQQEPPVPRPASAAAALPSFTFSADYGSSSTPWIDPTASVAPPVPALPPDLFPFADFAEPAEWDAALASSWLRTPAQHPSGPAQWDSRWDDLISSFQPEPARPSSTDSSAGGSFDGSYDIDLLMADISDEYSSSGFPSAPPSSIPEDDDWSSRGWSSNNSRAVSAAPSSVYGDPPAESPPSVSVEIGPWGGANWDAADPPVQPNIDPVDEAEDMDARLGWDYRPSNVKWLDPDVSSEVTEFPQGIKLTEKNKIYAFHRVTGCPSQFPFFRQRTGFLINLTDMKNLDPKASVDQLIRDQDSHSWGRSTGARNKPDAYLPGSFFGLSADVKISCRRAAPECGGVAACDSLDPAFLTRERRELDPEELRILAAATIRTREMQDTTEVGRTLAFHHSLQSWHCKGIRPDGTRCDGSICLRKLNSPSRNKNHILLCSKRGEALTFPTVHSQVQILDLVSEGLFVKVMNGERIIDDEDDGTCSRIVSGRTGTKGKAICPFNHHRNGLPYVANIGPLTCTAKMHIYCPWEAVHPELARMAIVVPVPDSGHCHPPPPNDKCTHAVAAKYRDCVRKYGTGATVNKVENAQSTKDLLNGKTPSLFHPGLIRRDTKTRLIQEVKAEWNELSSIAANTRQQVAAYLAAQEAFSDEKRFLQSSLSREGKRVIFGAHPKLLNFIHDLRTLDCDTTFKPVAGQMQIFEINGWMMSVQEAVTVMRVWMEVHDRAAYKAVWEEVQRLVLKFTKKPLKFKGLHKGGKILGVNSDMEAAPLLGLADALVPTVDIEPVRAVVLNDPQELLSFILRICYSHINRGIPKLLEHSSETRKRIFDFKYLKTREEVDSFAAWLQTLTDPHGVLRAWWAHKTMHRWLLRGVIQCLSNIPLEQWNTMEATTNLGEAQHAWNNAQTGISMGVIESFKKYEELDIRRAEEITMRKSTAISRTSRNEVTHRYASRIARQSRMVEKGKCARVADSTVAGLQTELSETQADLKVARDDAKDEPSAEATQRVRELEDTVTKLEGQLKLAKAEAKSNSSGRVRAPKAAAALRPAVPPQSAMAVPPQPADNLDDTVLGSTPVPPVLLMPASSNSLAASSTSVAHTPVDVTGTRRASTRKRSHAEGTATASTSSSKRRKRLEDPLRGWVMVDDDTGEELTGHEWVKRNPDEFAQRYKTDHQRYQRYLEYLEQSVD